MGRMASDPRPVAQSIRAIEIKFVSYAAADTSTFLPTAAREIVRWVVRDDTNDESA